MYIFAKFFKNNISLTNNPMKNFRTILAAILMLCCATLSAHDFEVEGIYYNILSKEDRTVEVTYRESYIEYSGNVVIPANVTYEGTTYSVTTIGNDAFNSCWYITSITIPNSVTTIGDGAFNSCIGLTSITIPNSVTTIGDGAFYYCDGITSITVDKNNPVYDSRNNCNAIIETASNTLLWGFQNTIIPNSVTTIKEFAFGTCRGLTSIEIPNSVTTIERNAFECCYDLKNVTIGNSVTTIEICAFNLCSLTSVTSLIPADKLFSIDNSVFNGVDKNACTLYVPYGAKETYASTADWNEFKNIVELPSTETFDLTVSAANYATLYLDFNATIPQGVEVYTASTVDGDRLMMQEVTGTLPANTGVIVRAEQGTYTFEQTFEKVDAIKSNLLRGSVEDVYITPAKDAKYYVLSMKDGIVGMYEDALSGGTFKNNANKAYLVLGEKNLGIYDEEVDTENPGMQLSNSYYFDFSGTTAIGPVVNEVEDNIYYDLSGRRVENPTRGIYILNGKKVFIK